MPRKERMRSILAKVETTYGTDATPTGAANALQLVNSEFRPMEGEEVSRNLMLPFMGHQGVTLVGLYGQLTGEVELAGAGAPGTAPAYGPLLRGCGFAEVINAGVDVQYQPVSSGHESLSIYFNLDGVRHVLLGARGTWVLNLNAKQIPRLQMTFTGLLGTITDAALPAGVLTGWKKPLPVGKANTTFSLHGHSGPLESLSINLGADIQPRHLINAESIEYVDRQMTGSAVLEAVSIAAKDWYSIAVAETLGALAVTHGVAAGNIVQLDADAVQIGRPGYGANQKIVNNSLPLFLRSGGTEFKITVK